MPPPPVGLSSPTTTTSIEPLLAPNPCPLLRHHTNTDAASSYLLTFTQNTTASSTSTMLSPRPNGASLAGACPKSPRRDGWPVRATLLPQGTRTSLDAGPEAGPRAMRRHVSQIHSTPWLVEHALVRQGSAGAEVRDGVAAHQLWHEGCGTGESRWAGVNGWNLTGGQGEPVRACAWKSAGACLSLWLGACE